MHNEIEFAEFVTFTIAGQIFGLPIARVQDVFKPALITRVPLAAPEIAGVLNLRGRIVTTIDMRRRLGVKRRDEGEAPMAIGIEASGESYGLLVDAVGEVLRLPVSDREANPISLDSGLAALSAGVYRKVSSLSYSRSTGCWICVANPRRHSKGSTWRAWNYG
jgi:purine-binding chemotaxis protein CheW